MSAVKVESNVNVCAKYSENFMVSTKTILCSNCKKCINVKDVVCKNLNDV